MKKKLFFIYDTAQAEFMLRRCISDFFKIGKGNSGDICVSFYDSENVRQVMTDWKNKLN